MSEHLKEQVKQIIDEGEGRFRSVIVQMREEGDYTRRVLEAAAGAIRHRGLSTSARELLPPRIDRFRAESDYATRQLREAMGSVASQVALASRAARPERRHTKARSRSQGLSTLRPLTHSHEVNGWVERVARRRKRDQAPIQAYWASSSAAMELDRNDLARLPEEVPNIVDIFPNRRIARPPVAQVDEAGLPANVREQKAASWGVLAANGLATWGAYETWGAGVKVAVLDTGIDADHPELRGKVTDWAEFDADGLQVPGSEPHDSDEHGTHCAGTVAGGGGADGESSWTGPPWIGMAPAAQIAGGLVLPGGGGTDAQILAGMQWAIDTGADVISMSLGGLQFSPDVVDTYTRTIINANRLGIVVVVAIGNEGNQTSGSPGNDYFAFTVGATDVDDRPAGFSGGRTQAVTESRFIDPRFLPLVYMKPEISAPGVAVRSCIPNGEYATWNGTSMATPHVAGAVALLLSATNIRGLVPPEERAHVIQDLLIGSVEELGESGQDHRYGFGRLDVLRAIDIAIDRGYGR